MQDLPAGPRDATLESLLLRVTKRCWSTVFSSAMRRTLPGHLTPQQLFVLAQLDHGACQPSVLAREHHVGMSAMTGLIDGLVARGLVDRLQDPHDRRAVQLAITDDGRAIWSEAQAAVMESARQVLTPLDSAQRERLMLALSDLDRVLETATDGGGLAGERSSTPTEHVAAEQKSAVLGQRLSESRR
ncbi:MAG TPA: MarR family transcriptional regulator [Chloroflexota bacterium]